MAAVGSERTRPSPRRLAGSPLHSHRSDISLPTRTVSGGGFDPPTLKKVAASRWRSEWLVILQRAYDSTPMELDRSEDARRVLVVDDEVDARRLAVDALEAERFLVDEALT